MIENMVNKKYGKLTVLEQYFKKMPTGERRDFCYCLCDCGIYKEINGKNIRRGLSTSCNQCGERLKRVYEACHKTNEYEFFDDYVVGYDSKGKEFYFDLEDYDLVKDMCWNIGSHGYAQSKNGRSVILMHNFIMNAGNRTIDHQDRKRNNNRKSNLRKTTIGQNNSNKDIGSNNTSGIVGVSETRNGWWHYYVQVEGKRIGKQVRLFEDAVMGRLLLEKEYYGEFAPQKHLFEKYGI